MDCPVCRAPGICICPPKYDPLSEKQAEVYRKDWLAWVAVLLPNCKLSRWLVYTFVQRQVKRLEKDNEIG